MAELNPEQEAFVLDNSFKYRKLYGIAGGGKTKCIIEKICELKRIGLIADHNEYLVLTFSRQACQDFILKGQRRDKKLFNNKSIRTIHSACSSIMYNSTVEENYMSLTTLVYETVEWLKINDIKREAPWLSKKCIFVDEAQDISEIQYQFVRIISNIYACPLILVGDPNQTIFQFQNGSNRFLLEHEGEAISLKINYRSNGNIIPFLNHFRPRSDHGYISAFRPSHKKPYIFIAEIDTCLAHLLRQITKSMHNLHDIAIIAPIKLSHSYCLSLSIVANFLSLMNIPFVKHYQDSEQDTGYRKVKEVSHGKINLYTIHGSKGLEYKRVFLFNFHFYTKAFHPSKEDFLENKYLWYVGLSRAIDELYIYALPENILFPTIYNCHSHLYDSNTQIVPKDYGFNEKAQKGALYSIKNFINTKTLVSEEKLYHLNKVFKATTVVEDLYHIDVELFEQDVYPILYGIFIDEWLFYKSVELDTYQHAKKRWFNTKIPLPKYLFRHIRGRMKRKHQIHYYNDYVNMMDTESDIEQDILKIIQNNLANRNGYFNFVLDANVCTYNQSLYYGYIDALDKADPLLQQIEKVWKVVLFQYQLDYECKYILTHDFSQHFVTLLPYINKIAEVTDFNESTIFQSPVIDTDIHLKGVMDGLDVNNIIHEFKFCNEISLQDHLQIFLYALIHYQKLKNKSVVLWNFKTGKKYTSTFSKDIKSNAIREYIKEFF